MKGIHKITCTVVGVCQFGRQLPTHNSGMYVNAVFPPSTMLLRLVASVVGTLVAYGLYNLVRLINAERTSPLRSLPGPKSAHWFFGNLKELRDDVRVLLDVVFLSSFAPRLPCVTMNAGLRSMGTP